jgi:phosphate transport system substrate-binding protein
LKTKSLLRILGVLLALTMVAAACGDDDDGEETETDDTEASSDEGSDTTAADTSEESSDDTEAAAEGGDLSGEVVVSGSSTVLPISIAVAESFKGIEPGVNVPVDGPGTGDGFALFCDGQTAISDASRPIREEESTICADNGIEYVELKVGIDGIAVLTNAENSDIECLSFGDLYALVGPESVGFESWSDANDLAATVGGNGGLPDAPLDIVAPGEESGTYDSFVEIVLEGIAEEQGQEDPSARVDYSSAADDNLIIENVTSNPSGFGWVGFAYAVEASGVKMIPIAAEGGGDCVEPTPDTIASNEYPIARDLFIYVNKAMAEENPAVVAYVEHYLSFGLDSAVVDVGYVSLTDEAKGETRGAWESR